MWSSSRLTSALGLGRTHMVTKELRVCRQIYVPNSSHFLANAPYVIHHSTSRDLPLPRLALSRAHRAATPGLMSSDSAITRPLLISKLPLLRVAHPSGSTPLFQPFYWMVRMARLITHKASYNPALSSLRNRNLLALPFIKGQSHLSRRAPRPNIRTTLRCAQNTLRHIPGLFNSMTGITRVFQRALSQPCGNMNLQTLKSRAVLLRYH